MDVIQANHLGYSVFEDFPMPDETEKVFHEFTVQDDMLTLGYPEFGFNVGQFTAKLEANGFIRYEVPQTEAIIYTKLDVENHCNREVEIYNHQIHFSSSVYTLLTKEQLIARVAENDFEEAKFDNFIELPSMAGAYHYVTGTKELDAGLCRCFLQDAVCAQEG